MIPSFISASRRTGRSPAAILRAAALALAGLCAALVIAEIAFHVVLVSPLRTILPVPEVSLYGPDPDAGYRHRPGASGVWLQENRTQVRISSLGLRDRERPLVPSGPRAIVVGNSFTEALQVPLENTAVHVAETLLQERLPGAEVVNLGIAGARPAVLVARLQSIGLALKPSVAVVAIDMAQLASPSAQDDSEFAGYRRADDGAYRVSHGFRQSRGFKLRSGWLGQGLYWLLDNSAVALVLNNRKNVGFWAEWPKDPPQTASEACADRSLLDQRALWIEGVPSAAAGVRDAFFRDLSRIGRNEGLSIVVAASGLGDPCAAPPGTRETLVRMMAATAAEHGLGFVDVDGSLMPPGDPDARRRLFGFGGNMGRGHLNEVGNQRYGELLAEVLGPLLATARTTTRP